MDGVVRHIYEAIETRAHLQNTLLVLCGDHGMNDAGNHGGSAESETSPALLFASPKLSRLSRGLACPTKPSNGAFGYYKMIEQSDIAPTLAGLLDFPVPLNNLGVFIDDFLPLWDEGMFTPSSGHMILTQGPETRIRLLEENAQQMLNVVRGTFPSIDFDLRRAAPAYCGKPQTDAEELHCAIIATRADGTAPDKLRNLLKVGAFVFISVQTGQAC